MMNAGRALSLLALTSVLPLLPGCGDDDATAQPDVGVVVPIDAGVPDAPPPPIDATPPADARPADLTCADDPPDTTPVPATITISAHAQQVEGMALAPLVGATVNARTFAGDTIVQEGTTDASGNVSLVITTNSEPFHGYVEISKDGQLSVYLFFADPLRASSTGSELITLSPALLSMIDGFLSNVTIQPGDGLIGLRAEDCQQFGVSMPEVTVEGGDDDTKVADLGALSDAAAGGGIVVNVPVQQSKGPIPTEVTVKASVSAGVLQDATIKVFADSISYIVMHP